MENAELSDQLNLALEMKKFVSRINSHNRDSTHPDLTRMASPKDVKLVDLQEEEKGSNDYGQDEAVTEDNINSTNAANLDRIMLRARLVSQQQMT